MMHVRFFLVWLLFLSLCGPAAAQSRGAVNPLAQEGLRWLAAPRDTLSLTRVRTLPPAQFETTYSTALDVGLTQRGLWVKKTFVNRGKTPVDSIFEVVSPYAPQIEFYQFDGNQLLRADTVGLRYAWKRQPRDPRNYWFAVTVPARDSVTCLLHVAPMPTPLSVRLFVWEASERSTGQAYFESAVIMSLFMLLGLYLFFLGAFIAVSRLDYFWYYFAYVALWAVYLFTDLGLGTKHLWAKAAWLQEMLFTVINCLYVIVGVVFLRLHYTTARLFPRVNQLIDVVIYANAFCLVCGCFFPFLPLAWGQSLIVLINVLFLTSSVIVFFLLGVFLYKTSRRYAGWFMFGFAVHGFSVMLSILQFFGLLPKWSLTDVFWRLGMPLTVFTDLSLIVGMMIEMSIVLLVGVGRFSMIWEEKNQALQQLAEQRASNRNSLILGVENERKRIAQDLHDGAGVQLSTLKLKLNVLREKTPEHAADIADIIRLIEQTNRDLRRLSHNLMPKSLARLGLIPAVEELVQQIQSDGQGLRIHFYCNVDFSQVRDIARISLFRIIQEALHNVLKHARASEVTLQLNRYNGSILLSVEDNGQGFVLPENGGGGLGLSNIRHRAEALHGKLSIESTPGRGAMLSVEFPVREVLAVQP